MADSLVLGTTGSGSGIIHAAPLSTLGADGFGIPLCSRNLDVLIDHRGDTPVPAVFSVDEESEETNWASVNCRTCQRVAAKDAK